ncbi:hypothetical protein HY932_03400 [Candidatus Falkowbacteria bacterium]|nr:hypothetical protein [Candidatus Falkowbacteria bacterium]
MFYLGREGAELALEKVAAKFPANKVTIVSCSCGAGLKDMAIKAVGLKAAQRIQCRKCGGQLAMHELLIRFLEDGELRVEFS